MKLYRYYDSGSRSDWASTGIEDFEVLKETPKGYWILPYGSDDRKFVLKDNGGRRYAYADLEAAWRSFVKRKQWQAVHLRTQLEHVEYVLANLDRLKGGGSIGKSDEEFTLDLRD